MKGDLNLVISGDYFFTEWRIEASKNTKIQSIFNSQQKIMVEINIPN